MLVQRSRSPERVGFDWLAQPVQAAWAVLHALGTAFTMGCCALASTRLNGPAWAALCPVPNQLEASCVVGGPR